MLVEDVLGRLGNDRELDSVETILEPYFSSPIASNSAAMLMSLVR